MVVDFLVGWLVVVVVVPKERSRWEERGETSSLQKFNQEVGAALNLEKGLGHSWYFGPFKQDLLSFIWSDWMALVIGGEGIHGCLFRFPGVMLFHGLLGYP